jgi:hypothetical protein
MKTIKLKNLCFSILICVFVVYVIAISLVHAAPSIPGVQRLEEGIVAYEDGDYDDAIFNLEMAKIQLHEDDKENMWKTHLFLGLSYLLLGDADGSRNEFINAKKIEKSKVPDVHKYSPRIVKLFKEAREVKTSVIPKTKLRSTPTENLSDKSVKAMLKYKDFYHYIWNDSASGFHNDYKLQNVGKVVYDRASGLMWQDSGSNKRMKYKNAKVYITKLNSDRFAGYNDWRLPTLEEAMSLMEPFKKNGDLYVDSVFDSKQIWIWTSDLNGASRAWVVNFNYGGCYYYSNLFYSDYYVRAVR